jgi:hypothetical protein
MSIFSNPPPLYPCRKDNPANIIPFLTELDIMINTGKKNVVTNS